MPQFAATIRHVAEGVKRFTVSAAVKNIEGWEETLSNVETPGARGITRDLERLKKLIQEDTIDGDAVKQVVAKLGKETATLASRAEGEKAGKIKDLGDALSKAAG